MQLSLVDLDHWLPGNDLVTRAKKVQFSDEFELFEPIVKCVFCSDPDVSKNLGNSSPSIEKKSKILADIKENFEFISSVATWAQVKEFFWVVLLILIGFPVAAQLEALSWSFLRRKLMWRWRI